MTKDFIDELIDVVEIKKTVKKSYKDNFQAKKAKTFEIAGVEIKSKRNLSDEAKLKISQALKGRVSHRKGKTNLLSEETKRKISEASKGRVASVETRKKISERRLRENRIVTEETRRKLSEARRGKALSEETKNKMREAKMGKVVTEETRRKLSEAHKGRVATEATRKILREAHKRRNYNRHVMTPNGEFESREVLKERLVADGVKSPTLKIREWFLLYPNDFYYIKKEE